MVPNVMVGLNTININNSIITLTLNWGEPFNNFDPIVNYTVSCSGDVTCPPNFTTTDNTTRSYTIINLTTMTTYTFSVVATNSVGSGEAGVVMITTPGKATSLLPTYIRICVCMCVCILTHMCIYTHITVYIPIYNHFTLAVVLKELYMHEHYIYKCIDVSINRLSLFIYIHTVPLIYNFTFTRMYTHGTTQYLASKNPWFAVEKFFSTRRVVASHVAFHDTSLGISTTRVISTTRGFPCNESWNLHATCMTVVIHIVIWQTNPREILLWL